MKRMTAAVAATALAAGIGAAIEVEAGPVEPVIAETAREAKASRDAEVKSALDTFRKAMRESATEGERAAAARALGGTGVLDPKIAAALAAFLTVDGDDVRIAAADGLGAYRGDARVTQALIGALPPNRKRPRVLDVILRALGRIGHSSALPALVEHLKDPRGRVAAAVAAALGDLGTPEAASALRNAQERLDRGRPLPGGDGAGRDGDAVMNEARRADHERREVLGTAIRNALSRIGQPAGR